MYRSTALLFLGFLLLQLIPGSVHIPDLPQFTTGYVGPEIDRSSYLFVGDVMLGRYVETLINDRGLAYLFADTKHLFDHYDHVIGNFEAPITEDHVQTEKDALQFSVASTSVLGLESYFTALSLANNHTFDHGSSALQYTEEALLQQQILPFGHPRNSTSTSPLRIEHEEFSVVVHGLNATGNTPASTTVAALRAHDAAQVFQVVYVHWGEEYALTHNEAQAALARELIDGGADAIIGHHPHVVQDIDLYNGVPVFYSLGNFIFDQYFSDEVQAHLTIGMIVENRSIYFQLIPMTSLNAESKPRLMTIDERKNFLDRLAADSHEALRDQILHGKIKLTEVLASL